MPDEQVVSANEILRSSGAMGSVQEGTYLQRTGLRLAAAVGTTAALIMFALVGRWIFFAPQPPVLPQNADPATIKGILDNYRLLQQSALEPLTTLFDSIVARVLLPVFTSILGFIFARANSTS
jgi:hypothetical protein